MISELANIFQVLTGGSKPLPILHFLPPPPPPKGKGVAPDRGPAVVPIDVKTDAKGREISGVYGFRDDRMADREGAEKWLTDFDKDHLKQRNEWGNEQNKRGKAANARNATCKIHWANLATIDECARLMGLSPSYVEKKYAAFSAALSEERGGA